MAHSCMIHLMLEDVYNEIMSNHTTLMKLSFLTLCLLWPSLMSSVITYTMVTNVCNKFESWVRSSRQE